MLNLKTIKHLAKTFNLYGTTAMAHEAGHLIRNTFYRFERYLVLVSDAGRVRQMKSPDIWGLQIREIFKAECLKWVHDPVYGFEKGFIDDAFARKDRCFGVFEGEKLIAYQFVSHGIVPLDSSVEIAIPKNWISYYKAFTLPEYRGKRIKSALTIFAANAVEGQQCVAFVPENNYANLRSYERLGYHTLGSFCVSGEKDAIMPKITVDQAITHAGVVITTKW